MINIVKELKIEILKGFKLLIRVIKRKQMFAFSLALFIVISLFPEQTGDYSIVRYILLQASAVVALTCSILYLFDFVAFLKLFIENKIRRFSNMSTCKSVTVTTKKS